MSNQEKYLMASITGETLLIQVGDLVTTKTPSEYGIDLVIRIKSEKGPGNLTNWWFHFLRVGWSDGRDNYFFEEGEFEEFYRYESDPGYIITKSKIKKLPDHVKPTAIIGLIEAEE